MALLPSRVYYPRAVVAFRAIFANNTVGNFAVVPRSVEVRRNSARKADEATVEIDYVDLPLDPRTLQALHISIHIENAIDLSIPMIPTPLNLRFVGNVDEPQVTLSNESDVLRLTARDYTAVFMARHWRECELLPGWTLPYAGGKATAVPTPPGMPLYTIIDTIRAFFLPTIPPVGILDPAAAEAVPNLVTNRLFWTPPEKDATVWDVMCGLCDLFALVPSFDGDVLNIRAAASDGFGTATMVYGQNVSKLMFRRNLARSKPHAVRVTAWNEILGAPMSATWGQFGPAGSPAAATADGSSPVAKVHEHHLPAGNYTPKDLAGIAQRIYDEGVKGRLEGEIETRDLTDTTVVTSLLALKNGDRLICTIGPEAVTALSGKTAAEAIGYLANPLRPGSIPVAVATTLVTAWTTANKATVLFYVNEATHKWSRDDGYTLTARFSDFVLGV